LFWKHLQADFSEIPFAILQTDHKEIIEKIFQLSNGKPNKFMTKLCKLFTNVKLFLEKCDFELLIQTFPNLQKAVYTAN